MRRGSFPLPYPAQQRTVPWHVELMLDETCIREPCRGPFAFIRDAGEHDLGCSAEPAILPVPHDCKALRADDRRTGCAYFT